MAGETFRFTLGLKASGEGADAAPLSAGLISQDDDDVVNVVDGGRIFLQEQDD